MYVQDISPDKPDFLLYVSETFLAALLFSGFGVVVKPMPRVLRHFFLNQMVLARNELLFRGKLLGSHPTF